MPEDKNDDRKINVDGKVFFEIRINTKLYQALQEAAKKSGMSLNDLVEKILTDYVAKKHAKD